MDWRYRPARDLGLPLGVRLRSHRREPGIGSRVLQAAWRSATRGYLALFHRLRVSGLENLPATPPFVLIANHASHLDALTLAAVLPLRLARHAYSLAAGEVFFGSRVASGFAAFAVNALPIWRKRTSARDLAFLRERLDEDGLIYILFPEGTRSRTGAMGPFRHGLGALVAGGTVPVVPCFLSGAFAAWPPTRRLPRPRRLHLSIGAPLCFPDSTNERSGWLEIAARCEVAVRALALQCDVSSPGRSTGG